MSVMLYKHPGKHKIHRDMFDYIIVDEQDVEETIGQGWAKTTSEAKELAAKPAKKPAEKSDGKHGAKAKELAAKPAKKPAEKSDGKHGAKAKEE